MLAANQTYTLGFWAGSGLYGQTRIIGQSLDSGTLSGADFGKVFAFFGLRAEVREG